MSRAVPWKSDPRIHLLDAQMRALNAETVKSINRSRKDLLSQAKRAHKLVCKLIAIRKEYERTAPDRRFEIHRTK